MKYKSLQTFLQEEEEKIKNSKYFKYTSLFWESEILKLME